MLIFLLKRFIKMDLFMLWAPGPGWINTNPIYYIFLFGSITLPIILPISWKIYATYKRRQKLKKKAILGQREEKKAERDRRKEIRRKKKNRQHNS
jgi:hypothetical protein